MKILKRRRLRRAGWALFGVLAFGAALSLAPVASAPAHATVVKVHGEAIDSCTYHEASSWNKYMVEAQTYALGFYLAGANAPSHGCQLPTGTWENTIENAGWATFPIYDGLQSSCQGDSAFSNTPSTARSQGVSAAKSAYTAASNLNMDLGNLVIYDDLEGYAAGESASQVSTCEAAAEAYVDGWVTQLHSYGVKAGLYSDCEVGFNRYADDVAHNPDDIYVAYWGKPDSTDPSNISSCVKTTYWNGKQRILQWDHDKSADVGVGGTVDYDCDYADNNGSYSYDFACKKPAA